jgi:hypothetical protein
VYGDKNISYNQRNSTVKVVRDKNNLNEQKNTADIMVAEPGTVVWTKQR